MKLAQLKLRDLTVLDVVLSIIVLGLSSVVIATTLELWGCVQTLHSLGLSMVDVHHYEADVHRYEQEHP